MGIIQKIAEGLRKTKDFFLGRLQKILNSFTVIDEELFDQLEETMIMSDIGVETSEEICDRLRKKIKERGITDPKMIMELIQEIIGEIMGDDTGLDLSVSPAVIMVIGVNGAGKTTTIGKMCRQFKEEGKKVLVAAADTFRAAAIDQLQVWTERAGVDIVKHAEGSDPGAVVYDALDAAQARQCDVVIIDTAGRLHNKKNLMDELAKINRIIDKKAPDSSREVLLVLDATTGQNAVSQAKLFNQTAEITGIVLTKLDGTAKGGIVISIKNELGIPVKLIGVGEKIDDLQPFNSRDFVTALFSSNEIEEPVSDETEEETVEDVAEEETETVSEIPEEEEQKKQGFFSKLFADKYSEDEPDEEIVEETEPEETTEDVEEETVEETVEEEAEEIEEVIEKTEPEEQEEEPAEEPEQVYDEEARRRERINRFFREKKAVEEAAKSEIPEQEKEIITEEETVEEIPEKEPEQKKSKKKGLFSRLFGKKDNDD
ncbi:MAG: signal recognition particle-docking protein FtsY [Ruminococcus sp.]|nr:signal recognition particle-docking protein FtsY [Ruminococcus sp.]MDE6540327.1 signal recognition particle-docking protein FtsY [Ruminococcus sp.]